METVLRIAVIYIFLLVAFRMMGKRDVGQMAPFDLVVLLLIPEIVSQGLVRDDFSLTNALTGVSTLLLLVFLTSLISFRSEKAGKLIEGEPTILVRHGECIPDAMNRERIDPSELMAQLHGSGFEKLSEVRWGILETDGTISFIPVEPGSGAQKSDSEKVI